VSFRLENRVNWSFPTSLSPNRYFGRPKSSSFTINDYPIALLNVESALKSDTFQVSTFIPAFMVPGTSQPQPIHLLLNDSAIVNDERCRDRPPSVLQALFGEETC